MGLKNPLKLYAWVLKTKNNLKLKVMEFKGTKGKWEATPLNDGSDLHAIFSVKNNTLIARTCYMPFSKANAQLIAHAPEMYEMLKQCYEYFLNNTSMQSDNNADTIGDLLTRATTI